MQGREAGHEDAHADSDHLQGLGLYDLPLEGVGFHLGDGGNQEAVAGDGDGEGDQEPGDQEHEVHDEVDAGQLVLVDAQALGVVAHLAGLQDEEESRAFDEEEEPHAQAEFVNKLFSLHPGHPAVVHHGHVAVHADQHEEVDAAVQVGTEKEHFELAQERSEGPVAAQGVVDRHERGGWGDHDVAQGQVELEDHSRVPPWDTETEDPQAGAVEDEAAQEDQDQEDRDDDGLGLGRARKGAVDMEEAAIHGSLRTERGGKGRVG